VNQERQVVEESLSPVTLPQAGIRQEFAMHWNMVPPPKDCNPAGYSLIMKQSTTRQIPRFIPGQPTHPIDRQDTAEHGFQY